MHSENLNNKKFVIDKVIDDLLNSERSLANPLLRLSFFAKLTKNEALESYTSNEINGYSANTVLPEYRRIGARLYFDFRAGWNLHSNNELPLSMFDEKFQTTFNFIPVFESIREVENMNSTIAL